MNYYAFVCNYIVNKIISPFFILCFCLFIGIIKVCCNTTETTSIHQGHMLSFYSKYDTTYGEKNLLHMLFEMSHYCSVSTYISLFRCLFREKRNSHKHGFANEFLIDAHRKTQSIRITFEWLLPVLVRKKIMRFQSAIYPKTQSTSVTF